MSRENTGLTDLGPAPKSSADWFLSPRPGRRLDAAEVGLGPAPAPRHGVLRRALLSIATFIFGS